MGWAAGLGILGPGILVPGVLLVLALAALMMAVRIVFAVVAAVGLCTVREAGDSELGASRLDTRSGEPLTNCSRRLSSSCFNFSAALLFNFPVSDGVLTFCLALLLRLSSFWTPAKLVISDVRMDVGRTGEGRDKLSAGVDFVCTLGVPLQLGDPPRGTSSLLVGPLVGVFT